MAKPMLSTEIVRFVKRNAYRPDLVAAHWHQRGGRLHDFAICVASPDMGFAYKVEMGELPEYTISDPTNGKILARGWRSLLKQMLFDGVIRETPEVTTTLGTSDMEQVRDAARGFKINAKAHGVA